MLFMETVDGNRRSWDIASRKYEEESETFEAMASEGTLLDVEERILAPLLDQTVVLHLQSGNGTDGVALSRLGATTVVGVDFSHIAAAAARQRAVSLGLPIAYAVADALAVPLDSAAVDLVYTGKGALMWLPDLEVWAAEVARVLRPGGYLFLYEAHPVAALWTRDEDRPRVRNDRSYFGGTRPNDSFPASAIERFSPGVRHTAIEWQWTLADIVSAVLGEGLQLQHLGEYPEPFWRPHGADSVAAWAGDLPNSFSMLAAKPN